MKIIDLLNKIANGEEAPKHIKYKGWLFSFDRQPCDYYCEEYGNLFEYLINEKRTIEFLNDEVEIIEEKEITEEEKKVPEKLDIRQEKNIKNNWKWKIYGKEHSYNISTPQKIIADKVNEICDYIKSKGE